MDEKIDKLKEVYKKLNFEKREYINFEDEEDFYYEVSGFEGNKELKLTIDDNDDYKNLVKILKKEFVFTPNVFGLEYDNKIEIALSAVNLRSSNGLRYRLKEKPVEIELAFFSNQLEIDIQYQPEKSLLVPLLELSRGRRAPAVLTIVGYKNSTPDGKENDLRRIVTSVLFDFAYSYNLVFEATSFDSLIKRVPLIRRNKTNTPDDKIQLIFKKYIPELIEYFNIGEKVDYPPFRFICYYHILEYFSDKSAYYYAAKKLKSLMLKPDFHINTDRYINQAINFFKIESTKYTSDKIKIKRVINQFINRTDFEDYLRDVGILDYFKTPITFVCSRELDLPAIDFENDSKFEETLTQRIYAMRCSIVHSNPDFEESKAVPFSPTDDNIQKLRREIDMIFEVARTIIVESSQ